jgi:hypothetical protein
VDALVSGALQSPLFGNYQKAIQKVVDATPSTERVQRLYQGQKDNGKELMPAFDIASVDAEFETSTLCIDSSSSMCFAALLDRLPTLCCSGVDIDNAQLVHKGFGAVFRELQLEFGRLSIALRSADDAAADGERAAAQQVADSPAKVHLQSYTPWIFGKLGQHYKDQLQSPVDAAKAVFLKHASDAEVEAMLAQLLAQRQRRAG